MFCDEAENIEEFAHHRTTPGEQWEGLGGREKCEAGWRERTHRAALGEGRAVRFGM